MSEADRARAGIDPMSEADGARAGMDPAEPRLPPEVAAEVGRLVGSPPVRFAPRAGGYTRAITGLAHLADGRAVFVKAADPACPADDPLLVDLADERATLLAIAAGPAAAHAPGIVGTADLPAPLLVLEDLSAAAWPLPYPDDLAPLAAALDALAAVPPPDRLERLEDVAAPDGPWERIAADPRAFLALGIADAGWLEAALPALVAAERRVRLAGDRLVHGDLWYANVCFASRGAVVVDWGSAMRGNPVLDRATLALDLVLEGRDPAPLAVPDLPAWLAYLGGHLAHEATQPPHPIVAADSTLRADQATDAAALLPALVRLVGLPPLAHTQGR